MLFFNWLLLIQVDLNDNTSHGFTAPQLEELRVYFNQMDTNGDGNLGIEEMRKALITFEGTTDTETVAAQMDIFDKNGNGLIGYNEFVKTIAE